MTKHTLTREVEQTVTYGVTITIQPAPPTPADAETLAAGILAEYEGASLYELSNKKGTTKLDGKRYRWTANTDIRDEQDDPTDWTHETMEPKSLVKPSLAKPSLVKRSLVKSSLVERKPIERKPIERK